MRKIQIFAVTIGIILFGAFTFYLGSATKNDNFILKDEEINLKNYSNSISMLYETSAGSGEYEESNNNTWPQDGYTFNETLSKCENGSTLSWNSDTKQVVMKGNVSDKCYVYFDAVDNSKKYNISRITSSYTGEIWGHKDKITKIVIENTLNLHNGSEYIYDISESKDKSVMAYMINNGDNTYTTYIQADKNIIANKDSSFLFYNFSKLVSIDGLEKLDTSNVTNMESLFEGCYLLKDINIGGWDVSNVTSIKRLFNNAKAIQSLNLESWKTTNITDMDAVFTQCDSLTSLNISSWDTSNVTIMQVLFSGCGKLTTIDISNWNTSNVTNMWEMFSACTSLTTLNISKWDTSKVTIMSSMFTNCWSLTSIDINNWDTSSLTATEHMFYGCKKLTSIDLSKWTAPKLSAVSYMFYECTQLNMLYLNSMNLSNISRSTSMFYNNLSTIRVYVKNSNAKTFIESKLAEANGGTVISAS